MKKIICLILTVMLIIPAFASEIPVTSGSIILYIGSGTSLVNDTETAIDSDAAIVPYLSEGRTFVPVRFISEALGLTVGYNAQSDTVTLAGSGTDVTMVIGNSSMKVNGKDITIDADNSAIVPVVKNGRTFLPMRALCEAVGKNVFYSKGLIIISNNAIEPSSQQVDDLIKRINILPVIGDEETLLSLLKTESKSYRYSIGGSAMIGADSALAGGVLADSAPAEAQDQYAPEAPADNDSDYSETNKQVQGVDEADIIKTDGKYIYQVNGQRIVIASIDPVEEMSITNIIKDENITLYPLEMYVDNDKLIVLSSYYQQNESDKGFYYRGESYLRCQVFDISNRTKPVQERYYDIQGNYVSSRKIGNIVYMVSNQNAGYYPYVRYFSEEAPTEEQPKYIVPCTADSAAGGEYREIPLIDICYIPDFESENYLSVSSINIEKPDSEANVYTLLGGGQNIYVSKENMYIANSTYNSKTDVYKFALNEGDIIYLTKGEVDGNIINQFSMDEQNGSFRIATTSRDKNWVPSNNIFIFDSDMQKRGSITGIAPRETIYSTRFVGDRCYMVTFEKVDPLFVIDLSNIDAPKILGELKIPGYSDYLHPVGENHLLGFGKDAVEYGSQAYYQGMKMALFDVSDVSAPKEVYNEIIGGRGTNSELLYNHKALLFDEGKNLLAFPVTVYSGSDTVTGYGAFEFNGAYVYRFGIDKGFELAGKITHHNGQPEDQYGYSDYQSNIQRILYANGHLFTASESKIQAHTLSEIQFVNEISVPQDKAQDDIIYTIDAF